jgi:hypothetical protein
MISYGNIARAVAHYRSFGYDYIDAPWLVSKPIAEVTKPPDRPHYLVRREGSDMEKAFVASGEQSFLYLINKGHLPEYGKLQTVTPCIRPDTFDPTHTKYFMKNELIHYNVGGLVTRGKRFIADMTDCAMSLFKELALEQGNALVLEQQSEDSWDILLGGVEVGSYGYRQTNFVSWVYGTGIAEPRFSSTLRALRYKDED